MKKVLFWLTLIVGIIAVIGACNKSEESTTATTTATTTSCAGATGGVEVSSCSDTPSGGITGIDNGTLQGIISTSHVMGIVGGYGVDNSTDCVDNASHISAWSAGSTGVPTGTTSMIMNQAITSSSTFAQRFYFYSDSSCQTEIAYVILGNSNFTVGDNVTGLSTTVTGKSGTYPSTATKVTYKNTCDIIKGSTAAGVTYLDTLFGGALDLVVGTEYKCAVSVDTRYLLMKAWDTSALTVGTDGIWYYEDSTSAYPTDWTDDVNTWSKMP